MVVLVNTSALLNIAAIRQFRRSLLGALLNNYINRIDFKTDDL